VILRGKRLRPGSLRILRLSVRLLPGLLAVPRLLRWLLPILRLLAVPRLRSLLAVPRLLGWLLPIRRLVWLLGLLVRWLLLSVLRLLWWGCLRWLAMRGWRLIGISRL